METIIHPVSSSSQALSLTLEEVDSFLNDKIVEWIQVITQDTTSRMEGYSKSRSLLNQGLYSTDAYFKALATKKDNPRFNYFRNKDAFLQGYASPKHFNEVTDPSSPTGKMQYVIVIKEGVKPSDAMNAFQEGPTITGCAEVCEFVYYRAIQALIGDEKFNYIFSADGISISVFRWV